MSAHFSLTRLHHALRHGITEDIKEAVFFLGEEADPYLPLCSSLNACETATYYGQKETLDALLESMYSDAKTRRKRAFQQYWQVIRCTGNDDLALHLVNKYKITRESKLRIFPKVMDPMDLSSPEFEQVILKSFARKGNFRTLALACESGVLEKPSPATVLFVLDKALEDGHYHIHELGDIFLQSPQYNTWIRKLDPLRKAIFMRKTLSKEPSRLLKKPLGEALRVVGEGCKLAGKMNDVSTVSKVLELVDKLGVDKTQMADLCCDAACTNDSITVLTFLVDNGLCQSFSDKWSQRFQRGKTYDSFVLKTKTKSLVFILENFRFQLAESGVKTSGTKTSWDFVVAALAEDEDMDNLRKVSRWAAEMKGEINLASCEISLSQLTPEIIDLLFEIDPSILDQDELKKDFRGLAYFLNMATNEKWLELLKAHRPEIFHRISLGKGSHMLTGCLHSLRYADNFRDRIQKFDYLSCSKFLDYCYSDCRIPGHFLMGRDGFSMRKVDDVNRVFRHMAGLRLEWPEFVHEFERLSKGTQLRLIDSLYMHGIEIVTGGSLENWAKKWRSTSRISPKIRTALSLEALTRRAVRIYVRASRLEVPMCCEDKVLSLHTILPRSLVNYLLFREPNPSFDAQANRHNSYY